MPKRFRNATHAYSATTTPSPLLSAATNSSTSSSTTAHLPSSINTDTHDPYPWRLSHPRPAHITPIRRRRKREVAESSRAPSPTNVPASYSQSATSQRQHSSSTSTSSSYHLRKSSASSLLSTITHSLSQPMSALCVAALLLLSSCCSICAGSLCETHSWWDPLRDKCIPCTVCTGEMIPLRPCQLHRDTICGSIYDLKIDWRVMAKTEPNWKERRKEDGSFDLEQLLTHEELQQLHDGALPTDWQTIALFMAVFACLLFFTVAACILMHHMRQWRRMERRLDRDVEELSTKLMAKLAEVQSLEGGTFFIGNAEALRVPTTFQPQHVLLPEKSAKQQERRILKTLQPGNVYIEENGSKG